MKKFWPAFAATTAATVALIYVKGYGYIFKALKMNIDKGPTTPSIDDLEKFPSVTVPKGISSFWQKSEDFNQNKIPDAVLQDLEKTNTAALLVVKNGKLAHEQYWGDHHAHSLMNSFSMAKGILSLLVGGAIDERKIESENQLLSDFLPQYSESEFGKFLTLKHLMTMQAGLDWQEEYHHPFAPNSKQYFVQDLASQVFERKVKEMPGVKYEYQSAAPQLLGFALRKAVGKPLTQYLSEKIWQPLGMESSAKWSVDASGMEKAFCCIHATARDFAKIGQLVLDGGKVDGKTIISEKFIQAALHPTAANDAFGYTIWANLDCAIPNHFLYGFLGQFIIIVPEKQMVIVKMGHCKDLPVDEKLRPLQVKLLVETLSGIF